MKSPTRLFCPLKIFVLWHGANRKTSANRKSGEGVSLSPDMCNQLKPQLSFSLSFLPNRIDQKRHRSVFISLDKGPLSCAERKENKPLQMLWRQFFRGGAKQVYIADQREVIQGLFPFTTMELEPVKKLAFVQTFYLARFCFCQNPRSPLFAKQITKIWKKSVEKKKYINFTRCRKKRAVVFLPMKGQEIPFALLARIAKNAFNFCFILETMSYLLVIISSYFISCLCPRPIAKGKWYRERWFLVCSTLFASQFETS